MTKSVSEPPPKGEADEEEQRGGGWRREWRRTRPGQRVLQAGRGRSTQGPGLLFPGPDEPSTVQSPEVCSDFELEAQPSRPSGFLSLSTIEQTLGSARFSGHEIILPRTFLKTSSPSDVPHLITIC